MEKNTNEQFTHSCIYRSHTQLCDNKNRVYTSDIFDDAYIECKLMMRTHIWGKFQSYMCRLNDVHKSSVLLKSKQIALNRVSQSTAHKRSDSTPLNDNNKRTTSHQLLRNYSKKNVPHTNGSNLTNKARRRRKKPRQLKSSKQHKAYKATLKYDTDAPVLDLSRFTTFVIHE